MPEPRFLLFKNSSNTIESNSIDNNNNATNATTMSTQMQNFLGVPKQLSLPGDWSPSSASTSPASSRPTTPIKLNERVFLRAMR